MSLRRNVLIFHQAALGDFVVTWPLAVALGRLFPQSRVLYVTHASKGQLAERAARRLDVPAALGQIAFPVRLSPAGRSHSSNLPTA